MNEKHTNEKYPLVSVIVPVRNGEETIGKLLTAFQKQDYPKDRLQVIIVDNGSRDNTIGIIKSYPFILEHENKIVSSYAARNKGLSVAHGEIIAFTDADCIPDESWISNGVMALDKQNADIAGGKIEFIFSEQKTTSELFDSINSLRNDGFIKYGFGAITANLFVRACIFNKIGLFPVVKSGGDIIWTGRSMKNGFSLIYAPKAVIYHPARDFKGVLRKSWFCGTGIFLTLKQRGWWFFRIFYLLLRLLIPVPNRVVLKSLFSVENISDIKGRRLAIWGISYLSHLSLFCGLVYSLFIKSLPK